MTTTSNKPITLQVIDEGDRSVGIYDTEWDVECPFSTEDEPTEEELFEFALQIGTTYLPFCQGKMVLIYDYTPWEWYQFEGFSGKKETQKFKHYRVDHEAYNKRLGR